MGKLLVFREGNPIKVWSHENFSDPANIVSQEIGTLQLPKDQSLTAFALCTVDNQFVFLTGGMYIPYAADEVFKLDVPSCQW